MSMPAWYELLRVLLVIDTVPETLFSVPDTPVLKATFASAPVCEVFTPSMTLLASVKFVTLVPKMPLVPMFVIFMKFSDGLVVELRLTAWLVVFWIVPPVQVETSEVQVPALPVTLKVPEPTLLMMMPFVPPVALTLRKVTLDAPMVALAMFTAGPVGAVVAPMVLMPVTLTVRP